MTDTPLSDDVLKPCPFCGAELLKEVTELGRYWIHPPNSRSLGFDCILVDVSVGDFNDDRIAWNTRAALEAATYGELERYLNESRPYLEAFRLKEAGQALMGEIDRMPVRQLCKRADALLSSIGASQP